MNIVIGCHVEVPEIDKNAERVDVDFSLCEVLLMGDELVDQDQLFLTQKISNMKGGSGNE